MDLILKKLQNEGRCFVDEPLGSYCFMGIGGKAKIFVLPRINLLFFFSHFKDLNFQNLKFFF